MAALFFPDFGCLYNKMMQMALCSEENELQYKINKWFEATGE